MQNFQFNDIVMSKKINVKADSLKNAINGLVNQTRHGECKIETKKYGTLINSRYYIDRK